MTPAMYDDNRVRFGLRLFTVFLFAVEIYQFFLISQTGFIRGDYWTTLYSLYSLNIAFALSLIGWALVLFLTERTRSTDEPRVSIPDSNWILLIFIINYVVTSIGNVGSAIDATKSSLSIITTIIPISLLILALATQKIGWRFYLCTAILILIDLHRQLLGAFFQVVYIFLTKAKKVWLFVAVLLLPILISAGTQLTEYKYSSRGMDYSSFDFLLLDATTARISTTITNSYGIDRLDDLSKMCHSNYYSSQYLAAVLSVIPKNIFGLKWVKTYNNCIIEHRLGQSVDDSSVNSPWLLNLAMILQYDTFHFIMYFLFSTVLIYLLIRFSNFFFGKRSDIVKYWIIFMFIWTGNILTLTIPLYAFGVLFLYFRFKNANELVLNYNG